MASPLLKATGKTIIPLLSTYKGTILPHITTLPPQYTKITNQTGEYLQRTYLFQNFKQAFSHFMLTTKTCQQYNYYPEIFNVYNKIVIKLSSSLDGHRKITSKDVYIGLLLNQINSNTVHNAHEVCLQKIKQII